MNTSMNTSITRLIMPINLSEIAVLKIKNAVYRCIITGIS